MKLSRENLNYLWHNREEERIVDEPPMKPLRLQTINVLMAKTPRCVRWTPLHSSDILKHIPNTRIYLLYN